MRKVLIVVFAVLVTAYANAAVAAEVLVDVAWVKANTGTPGVVLVDLRSSRAYRAGHVPGVVNTDYRKDGWRVKKDGVPGMLPEVAKLETLVGRLGIGNDSHVVLLPAGVSAAEMGVATRIYWTLKVLGHDEVSIVNGGMTAYVADKANPLEKGAVAPQAAAFKASLRRELLATAEDVRAALTDGTAFLDNRPNDTYLGVNTPRPKVARAGTLPGAVNVPGLWLTEDNGGLFRDADTVRALYAAAGAPVEGETITFCNTGHWASLGWFVNSEILGNKETRMYDGSMAEWSRDPANPMETKITLP
jgi:thiosulfate/3-mercaptopyruvate sulfurtransferase